MKMFLTQSGTFCTLSCVVACWLVFGVGSGLDVGSGSGVGFASGSGVGVGIVVVGCDLGFRTT